jgi:HK97 family phage major capsid protein
MGHLTLEGIQMSDEPTTRGKYTDALKASGRRLLHGERTLADVQADIADGWTRIVPGSATAAQGARIQKLNKERWELINAPAYKAAMAKRSRASGPAGTTHKHECGACEGRGTINTADPVAMARLTPAARRAVLAQARAVVPTPPPHRSTRQRSALAREAGIYGLTRDNILEDDVLLRASLAEVRDFADKEIERSANRLTPAQTDRLHELVHTQTAEVNGKDVRFIAITSAEPYVSAFGKALRYSVPGWDRTEARSIQVFREVRQRIEGRAAAESGSFGLAIPVMIDPTIIVQVQDAAEILNACKQVTITTDAWHGVSSPGATLVFKGEAAVDTDAAVVLAQPYIPVFSAVGDFSGSLELFEDYPGLVTEVGSLFGNAYRDQVSEYTSVGAGTGSSVPLGVFTAMSNQTTSPAHISVHSAGTLAASDVRAVFAALPERYQLNASWLMSPSMVQAVAALAAPSVTNGLAPHDYAPASQGQPARLLGRPVVVSSYAPSFANATSGQFNWCVVGDFSRYLVVNRLGASLELIPQLRDQATARPTGQRAYFYQCRWGAGPVDSLAFRLLSNG